MIKILKGERVYIPVRELLKAGLTMNFSESDMEFDENYGYMVSEDVFNNALALNPDAFMKNGGLFELTRVSSLSCRVEDMNRLMPLKLMFLKSMGVDEDDAVDKIISDDNRDMLKFANQICSEGCNVSVDYLNLVSLLKKNYDSIVGKLHKYDVDLQFLTEIRHGSFGLMCFVVGKGIFYEIYIKDWDAVMFDGLIVVDNVLHIPDLDDVEDTLLDLNKCRDVCDRDFRGYGARENLLWCLQNMKLANDFEDEISCRVGGVSVSVNLSLFAKFMNSVSFLDEIYIDGIVDVFEKNIVPVNPYK